MSTVPTHGLRAVLFDMDGTLVETEQFWGVAMAELAAALGGRMSDAALGDAIVEYHKAHWGALGVEYIIWQQRMLSSPGGSWKPMSDRGSPTANHMDHPHVNYRG